MSRWVWLFLAACASGEEVPDVNDDDGATAEVSARLSRYLRGRFDSTAQSQEDPSYFAIELIACRVDLPDLGEDVMYVQQQQVGELPYRQRLYKVEGVDAERARTVVYSLTDAPAWTDFCDGDTTTPVSEGTHDRRRGCGVSLTWDAERERFEGGTEGTDCETSLGGDYAASEVTVTPSRIVSWDRGFNDDGSQAWGAVDGGYVFDRLDDVPED